MRAPFELKCGNHGTPISSVCNAVKWFGLSSHWLKGDIASTELQPRSYDVWHDRAVFHFLTATDARMSYVRQVAKPVKAGGHVIVSTFGPEGPTRCRGLDVVQDLPPWLRIALNPDIDLRYLSVQTPVDGNFA